MSHAATGAFHLGHHHHHHHCQRDPVITAVSAGLGAIDVIATAAYSSNQRSDNQECCNPCCVLSTFAIIAIALVVIAFVVGYVISLPQRHHSILNFNL